MSKSLQDVSRAVVRDIPLNKLVPSPDNVRKKLREGVVTERAASILAHGLLQSLTVRPQLNDDKRETGKYEVIAGCTRLYALRYLAAKKQIAKNAPIPCNVREDGIATELSLAENIHREELHPADQFEAFRDLLQTEGVSVDDIAARFGVTARTVKERLKLGSVSPDLIGIYREGGMGLDQLMAFTVIDDHIRQKEVWENLPLQRSPDRIRRVLREGQVSSSDKRASFVGQDAYEAAGGIILRDLFSEDHGGYLTDPALLDRLALAKLEQIADEVRKEGWKWVERAIDFPHHLCMRRIQPKDVPLSQEDIDRMEAIEAELEGLEAESEQSGEYDAEMEAKVKSLNAEYERLNAKAIAYAPDEYAIAGAFLSITYDGRLEIDRGLVRREDEPKVEFSKDETPAPEALDEAREGTQPEGEEEEPEERLGYSDRLIMELSAHRTLAMRDALGANTELAMTALTHTLALQTFYISHSNLSCLKVSPRSIRLEAHAPGIGDGIAARRIAARHEEWTARLPEEPEGLWDFVRALQSQECLALLAHCTALCVEDVIASSRAINPRSHADQLAEVLSLNMREYWKPTVASYLGRVSKAQILEAVREGVSEQAAEPLVRLKKSEMAHAAEDLLSNTSWLPDIWRSLPVPIQKANDSSASLPQAAE